MSEKMRDSFEAWASQFFRIDAEPWGEYVDNETQWAWQAWQASRAALVVELPEKAALMSASSVYAALDGAGVSYK